jgi:Mg-chelatase subunit ChlD
MKTDSTTDPVHIYVVLDRSGSMESIRSDIVGGFNSFIASQAALEGECRVTLVQFDTQDPREVIADALPLAEVRSLTEATFVPRGGTPLFDAIGATVADATIRAEQLAAGDHDDEDIVFVILTDGQENSSVEYDRAKVFELIKKREARGWTFVYIGANQDAYAEGGAMGMATGNTQAWMGDAASAPIAFESLDRATASFRHRRRGERSVMKDDYFEGVKEAEADLASRTKS